MQATRENLPCSNRLLPAKPNTPQQVVSAEAGLPNTSGIAPFPSPQSQPSPLLSPCIFCSLNPAFVPLSTGSAIRLFSCGASMGNSPASSRAISPPGTLSGHWQLHPIAGKTLGLTACSPPCPQYPYLLLCLGKFLPICQVMMK